MSQALCPVLATNHNNIITQNNVDSLLLSTYTRTVGTRVTVSCYVPAAFKLDGPSQVVCDQTGQWSPGVPTCVRKSNNNNNNNNNNNSNGGGGVTEDTDVTTSGDGDDSILSDYSIIVIAVAAAFVVILIIILLVFLCKHFGGSRRKDDDDMKEPIVIQYPDPTPRPRVAIVKVDNMFSAPSQVQNVYTGPSSPPSWHSHPIIVMADEYKHRTWSQLSMDHYLREMDTSRRENPNHTWRDFATLSSYFSPYSSSSI